MRKVNKYFDEVLDDNEENLLIEYAYLIGKPVNKFRKTDMINFQKWVEHKFNGGTEMSLTNVAKQIAGSGSRVDSTSHLAKRLLGNSKIIDFKPEKSKRSNIDFRSKVNSIKKSGELMQRATKIANAEVLNQTVPFDCILKYAAECDKNDRSVKSLEAMISKKSIDSAAKSYWEDYYGASFCKGYGKDLVKEYKDIVKYRSASIKQLIDLTQWFSRTYGNNCVASSILIDAMVDAISVKKEKIQANAKANWDKANADWAEAITDWVEAKAAWDKANAD